MRQENRKRQIKIEQIKSALTGLPYINLDASRKIMIQKSDTYPGRYYAWDISTADNPGKDEWNNRTVTSEQIEQWQKDLDTIIWELVGQNDEIPETAPIVFE